MLYFCIIKFALNLEDGILFVEILFLLVLILINAFFSSSEIALISLNDNKIKYMAEKGDKKSQMLYKLLEEPSRFLATIQIGITLAGFLASAFASESFADRLVKVILKMGISVPESTLKTISMIIITLVLSYFTLVLGELVPKRLAMRKAESISRFSVKPLTILSRFTSPFVRFLTFSTNSIVRLFGINPDEKDGNITEEEIRMMIAEGEEKGSIRTTEKNMINNIFEFDNKKVTDIMTHRTDIVAIQEDKNLSEIISIVSGGRYTRFPVYKESIDNIIGLINAKDLLQYTVDKEIKKDFSLVNMLRPVYYVPSSKKTNELFFELQKNKIHFAVIIDEYGGTEGIVTMEDLIEEIVGDIFDEYDVEERDFIKIDDNISVFSGATSLDIIKEYLDISLPVETYETLSGFIIGEIGRFPDINEKPEFNYNGVTFSVEEMDEKRISKVRISKN